MNEELFNKDIRKFLKKVGITAQREIEKAVWLRVESGELKGNERFKAQVTLEITDLDLKVVIEDEIRLE